MILIPAAGDGRRFREAGYTTPKHDLPILGVPMAEAVVENVRILDPHGFAFVITQNLVGKTKGAVDTILKGVESCKRMGVYRENEPLIIANCDQLLAIPEQPFGWGNGVIFTFKSNNSAHSYVTVNKHVITDIVEKPLYPPSDQAVSGVYAFPTPGPFIDACYEAQKSGDGGEQYVSSALKIMVGRGYTLYSQEVPTGILGTPEDYDRFVVWSQIAGRS